MSFLRFLSFFRGFCQRQNKHCTKEAGITNEKAQKKQPNRTRGLLRHRLVRSQKWPSHCLAGKHRSHGINAGRSDPSVIATFRSLADRVRTFAAAFEALIALSLRCLAVRALARARPPRLPISDITFATRSSVLML